MKRILSLITLAVLAQPVFAQIEEPINEQTCEPKVQRIVNEDSYKEIYPFKPLSRNIVECRIKRLTESSNYSNDIREITARGLTQANTKVQPWGGSFWPLNQGQIANPYQDKNYSVMHGALSGLEVTSIKYNYAKYQHRQEKVHAKIYDVDEKQLAELAPSEKYDLLLGDTSFDLTNRIWNYATTWAEKKKWGFLASIDLPAGYRIPEASSTLALWEGICHGWAVASGHYDRPNKTVWVTLPNNKKMPFYPNDLKALISLMWANSTIQDSVIVEGLRCNRKYPEKDEHGRYIDREFDRDDKTLLPRCADVHPAVYHTSIVNLLGIEGRSFVADMHAQAAIGNQPVSGYEYKYFNPETGKEGSLEASVLSVDQYKKDPFKDARHPQTRYIVGVDMTLKYVDWEDPIMHETNYPSDDKISDASFNYDLELDADYKIIGGQWRVAKDGSRRIVKNRTNQPDFFWVVPRDYKNYFKPLTGLPEWNFGTSTLPPQEYKTAARGAHGFLYEVSGKYAADGKDPQCEVLPIKRGNGEVKKVDCTFKYPRPQPLINVVNKLLEESRR